MSKPRKSPSVSDEKGLDRRTFLKSAAAGSIKPAPAAKDIPLPKNF